ncbi:RNA polymerase sigma factor [Flagellimonas meridianipacifica]|uniref:RNA polymerase sigma factor n=1 Tax=Flagellimonas meridianipacifica TaxID=1080225 RepID=A0A2T0MD68_9FLAO|nr:sigma-70 family RNA polymerase sigma factor [Allomuricauda pacifica]PRX55439.1 RNA polymerase sigma-70 factor (ECF subfamily) [Allomuricauda pacifica]
MTDNTDQYLIKSTLKGDTKAFASLVTKHQNYVYTLVIRMIKTKEEAEEVTQDVFIKAYKSLKDFKGDSKFTTWLYRISYRAALDHIRKNKKRQKTNTLLEEITESNLTFIENPLEQLEDQERKDFIKRSIARLSESEAAIVTLFYFEELSIKEIGKVTRLTEDNVKVKLHRSRKKLYEFLQPHPVVNEKE